MNRSDFQILADARIDDSAALVEPGRWAGAYYLLGYSVECALKACAAKQFREFEVPEKAVINDFYTHRFDKLVDISGVRDKLEDRVANDLQFRLNWDTVREWTEISRYDHSITEGQALEMQAAVRDPSSGVLTWLKTTW